MSNDIVESVNMYQYTYDEFRELVQRVVIFDKDLVVISDDGIKYYMDCCCQLTNAQKKSI